MSETPDDLREKIERLTEENMQLKQEIAKLLSVKMTKPKRVDSMSTKLKEALRE